MNVTRHFVFRCGLLLLPVLLVLSLNLVAQGAVHQVTMGSDLRFHPDPVNIVVGDSIDWVNSDTIDHTSTSGPTTCLADGLWNSGILLPGQHFGRTFQAAGTTPYFCALHCSFGMRGSVVVRNQTPAAPTTWAEIKALFRD